MIKIEIFCDGNTSTRFVETLPPFGSYLQLDSGALVKVSKITIPTYSEINPKHRRIIRVYVT